MKALGIIMLVIGYVWIGCDIFGLTSEPYTVATWQSKQLTKSGETVTLAEATNAVRDANAALGSRHKMLGIPASMMLVGGLLAAYSKPRKKRDEWRRF